MRAAPDRRVGAATVVLGGLWVSQSPRCSKRDSAEAPARGGGQALPGGAFAPCSRAGMALTGCGLVLGAACTGSIPFVSLQRERWQPGFAADGPEFVGGRQLVGGVEAAEVHLNLIAADCEHRRAAGGPEAATGVAAGVSGDGDGGFGEHR